MKKHFIWWFVFSIFLLHSEILQAKKWPVYARHGMVVSTERIASEVGVEILKQGGNAVDAAVAVGFTLAVVHPAAGNIGGGGFMVIRLADGRVVCIDYREKAPKAAHEKMYLDEKGQLIKNLNHEGYLAVGVPGTVAGLTLALKKFGTMPLSEVMKPAINLAENGFPVSYAFSQDIKHLAETFKKYPASARVFLKNGQVPYEPGEMFVQKDLAATLKRIARYGRDGFYRGKTAELIEKEMKAHGGLITREDLAEYEAVIRKPIVTTYRDYTVYSMPPPSSGGITLAIMLNILEGYNLAEMGHNSAQYIHVVTEAMRRAYADRAHYLGDPDFNPDMPVEWLISKKHGQELRKTIDLNKASVSKPNSFEWSAESTETTHFSVVDAQGNAVSNTYTLEQWYGSKIVVEGAGFLLNNEMGDFNPWPGHTDTTGLIGTRPNLIQPGKRMLSSMTPTIVTRGKKTFLVIGSPGGRTIINTVLQTILNVVDFGMNIFEAIDAPRFHHQWLPDVIKIETWGVSKDTVEKLKAMGHRIAWRSTQGRAMGILIDPETGLLMGAADPRSPNRAAVGY
ncbi:MAG: gamma-glutamyltransferase [Calditrichaeota bacterium]|nr:MAG: gamma-glutamyltransferase [Calditrichota bacterium]